MKFGRNNGITEGRKDGTTEGHGESSIAPLFQSGAIKMFEYFGHIHVYSPGAGADNIQGQKYFPKHKSSVHLLIPSKLSDIK